MEGLPPGTLFSPQNLWCLGKVWGGGGSVLSECLVRVELLLSEGFAFPCSLAKRAGLGDVF